MEHSLQHSVRCYELLIRYWSLSCKCTPAGQDSHTDTRQRSKTVILRACAARLLHKYTPAEKDLYKYTHALQDCHTNTHLRSKTVIQIHACAARLLYKCTHAQQDCYTNTRLRSKTAHKHMPAQQDCYTNTRQRSKTVIQTHASAARL